MNKLEKDTVVYNYITSLVTPTACHVYYDKLRKKYKISLGEFQRIFSKLTNKG